MELPCYQPLSSGLLGRTFPLSHSGAPSWRKSNLTSTQSILYNKLTIIQMRRLRVQSPVPLPVDLHVHHPGFYKVRCIGAGGYHAGSLRGSGWHGDCVDTDVQESWRASCTYCSCRDLHSIPAGSIPALLLRRQNQRRQQEDRHDVSSLKIARPHLDTPTIGRTTVQPKALRLVYLSGRKRTGLL